MNENRNNPWSGSWWMVLVPLVIICLFLFVGECNAAESDSTQDTTVIVSLDTGYFKSTSKYQSDSLYYVSATDMIEKVNSVIGVCDTTWDWKLVENEPDEDGIIVDIACYYKNITTITCRKLIDVVVVTQPKTMVDYEFGLPHKTILGQIVVWWEKVVK